MHKLLRLSTVLFLLVFVFQDSYGQERELKGKVTSKEDGKGLSGATVLVKGTNLGAATDMEGNYDIKGVPADAKTLVISAVSYKVKEVEIGASDNVDVSLESDYLKLDQVV